MTDDKRAGVLKLMQLAEDLGLTGLMILSPRCEDCGTAHDFKLVSNMLDVAEVQRLLNHFATVSTREEPDLVIEERLQ